MGNLLVVGSVAFDSVRTPFGEASDVLGGSATYFSTSASFFTDVNLIAVVGEDFPKEHLDFLRSRGINLDGLEQRPGKTFRWRGEYSYQLNEAQTLETHLNVLETFRPKIPASYTTPSALFLGNIDPELQLDVLNQVKRPSIVACDTMNFWIEGKGKRYGKSSNISISSLLMTGKPVLWAMTQTSYKWRNGSYRVDPKPSLLNAENMGS